MSDEWGPWIEHDGKGCPLAAGVLYESQAPCGCCLVDFVDSIDLRGIDWFPTPEDRECNQCHDVWPVGLPAVIRYRIRKPRGLTILENLIADLPAPAAPKVDA